MKIYLGKHVPIKIFILLVMVLRQTFLKYQLNQSTNTNNIFDRNIWEKNIAIMLSFLSFFLKTDIKENLFKYLHYIQGSNCTIKKEYNQFRFPN